MTNDMDARANRHTNVAWASRPAHFSLRLKRKSRTVELRPDRATGERRFEHRLEALAPLPSESPIGLGLGLEGCFDVVAERESELGRGRHDAPEAYCGSDRDQNPHDFVKTCA